MNYLLILLQIDVREWDIGKPAHPDEMMYEPVDLKKEADVDASGRSKRDKRKRNEASDDESRSKFSSLCQSCIIIDSISL